MKFGIRVLLAASLIVAVAVSGCRKKRHEGPDYANGIDDGSYTVDEKSIDETVNINGGTLIIEGETDVTSDINMKEEGGALELHDSVTVNKINMDGGAATLSGGSEVKTDINMKTDSCLLVISDTVTVGKINMQGGEVIFTGSPTINLDLNQNKGTVYIGDCHSTLQDTMRIKVNYNIADTLYVLGGVVVVERDLNMNKNLNSSYIDVEDGAKIIVRNHFNIGGAVHGMRNITAEVVNYNVSNTVTQEPVGKEKCPEAKK